MELAGKFVATGVAAVDIAPPLLGAAVAEPGADSGGPLNEIEGATLGLAEAAAMLAATMFVTAASGVEGEIVCDAKAVVDASDGAAIEEVAATGDSALGLSGAAGMFTAKGFGTLVSAVGAEITDGTKGTFGTNDDAPLDWRLCETVDFAAAEFPALEDIVFEVGDEADVGEGQSGTVGADAVGTVERLGAGLD